MTVLLDDAGRTPRSPVVAGRTATAPYPPVVETFGGT